MELLILFVLIMIPISSIISFGVWCRDPFLFSFWKTFGVISFFFSMVLMVTLAVNFLINGYFLKLT